MKSEIGLIGLATMGANLARNIANKNFSIAVYNRSYEKTEAFLKEFGNEKTRGVKTLEEFVSSLEKPRKILILVKAGEAIDEVIKELNPLLDPEDIVVDLGNSNYHDTERRSKDNKFIFMGAGISGGEQGALHGPSIMPGGPKNAYSQFEKIFTSIAAEDGAGGKCVTHIGPGASGHFVKMVHNGIEYAVMQLIAESYDVLRKIGNYNNESLAKIFDEWNKLDTLNSFLIEITAEIFAHEKTEQIIDHIKNQAGQKGTGKWTTEAALELGVPTPTINAAVDTRIISGDSARKHLKNNLLNHPLKNFEKIDSANLEILVRNALECSIVCAYHQGFQLLEKASEAMRWDLNLSEIARIWRGGCIIRAEQLEKWQRAYANETQSQQVGINEVFEKESQQNWRKLVALAASRAVPIPATAITLSYFDAYTQDHLPQNLIQAQRDFFGAHGYERTDKPRTFHTNWNH